MISVIIPCHNCEGFINRSVDSVLNQTYQDVEIILVNNNSSDNSLELLNRYQSEFPNKIFVFEESKKGAPAARNHGLYKARGEWIQFLDADDELSPDKLQGQLNIALATGADIVAGACLLLYKKKNRIVQIIRRVDKDIWKGLITSNLGITSSNLWRKQAFLDVNGWDETLSSSQEYDVLFRLLKNNAKVAVDNSVKTTVHFSNNSVSKSRNKKKLKQILDNRINLRLEIKDELLSSKRLTPKLAQAIDTYIYTELMDNYLVIPEYVNELMNRYHLDVKYSKIVKLNVKMFLKRLYVFLVIT
ncbi:MAG TPA: glycosyltransferase family A protein [Mucilaginibacter sp.]|nr:glycosyltransferase family A protein [Mucilaginibacter sp.]